MTWTFQRLLAEDTGVPEAELTAIKTVQFSAASEAERAKSEQLEAAACS